tara:strand:- start:204 stop:425 length:222 start_codon:yes stop_codon:yes gene_type:complete
MGVLGGGVSLALERAFGLFAGGLFDVIGTLLTFLLQRFVVRVVMTGVMVRGVVMRSLIVHGDVLRVSETSPEL